MAGRKWLKGFLKHHLEIRLKTSKNLSIACAMGANKTVILNCFKLLKEIKDKFDILSPCQIWSGDETGCTDCTKRSKGSRVQEDKNISASKWGTGEDVNGSDICKCHWTISSSIDHP